MPLNNNIHIINMKKSNQRLSERFQEIQVYTPCHHHLERLSLALELTRHRLNLLHSPDFIPPVGGADKFIITVHDLTFLHYPQYLTDDSKAYYNQQIEAAVQQADHILCDSNSTRIDLMEMLAVPEDKITVHMLGVDDTFKPLAIEASQAILAHLNLPDSYFLFVGTLEPRKNFAGLLKAYTDLQDQYPDCPPLVIIGKKGWLFEGILAQIEQLNSKRIIWKESIETDQLPAVYNQALAVLTPSFYEGFGLPALEGMACGTVPIVSNRSSLPEIVGDVGILIEPEDSSSITKAMEKVQQDSEWRITMQQKAIERAQQFTWEKTAEIVLNSYQKVLQS
ncbi:glycosyltransferase family 1 protein [Anaerolineales bacterium]